MEYESFFQRHKILRGTLIVLLVLIIGLGGWLWTRMRGPHPNYRVDLMLPTAESMEAPGRLKVGVAKRSIAPIFDNYDTWTDVNGNTKYDEGVDTYVDRDGNGRFDGIWIAGFGTNRPAQGMHDEPNVRALALRNNGVTVVIVSLDSVGIFYNDFIDMRKMVNSTMDIDHILFSSTHCHETPDTMKIWSYWKRIRGADIPVFGYAEHYMDLIKERTKEAVEEAVVGLQDCDLHTAKVEIMPEGFVDDSRKPIVIDNSMYLMRFTKPFTDETIATFVNWGNHPETLGGSNPLITSDFPHWIREGLEKGVPAPNGVEGFGGMCIYVQGMVGGLMTQLHTTVPHRDGKQKFEEASWEKVESLGYNLAIVAATALRDEELAWKTEKPIVQLAAETFPLPIGGAYKYAMMLGIIHPGYKWGGYSWSEMNVLRVGETLMLTVPGEIYPEIVEGGVEYKAGNDFGLQAPVEAPRLRDFMEEKAKMGLVVGLANDQIGYIVPKSQWDDQAPFVYDGAQYGEENSPGPETAPTIHRQAVKLLKTMNENWIEPEE